jgi:hypothetical protein
MGHGLDIEGLGQFNTELEIQYIRLLLSSPKQVLSLGMNIGLTPDSPERSNPTTWRGNTQESCSGSA